MILIHYQVNVPAQAVACCVDTLFIKKFSKKQRVAGRNITRFKVVVVQVKKNLRSFVIRFSLFIITADINFFVSSPGICAVRCINCIITDLAKQVICLPITTILPLHSEKTIDKQHHLLYKI